MNKTLIILESPGKIQKFSQYLGSDYIIKASVGHVEELEKVDVENNFTPIFKISQDKIKVVKELKQISKISKEVIIATDADREGEAIAASLAKVLNLKNPKRMIFNEITKTALIKALNNPIVINNDLVNAQITRRNLDWLIGYKISPILWKFLENAKSAGRVQSVVLKIINDKEIEINNSISNSYFKTYGIFSNLNSILNYNLFENEIDNFINLINKKTIIKIINIDNKKSIRKPSPPFITSTLQQEASTKCHYSVKQTMDIAQKLYEAGLITYMRTDSPSISNDAILNIEKYIIEHYGLEYSQIKTYESKNINSQEAHECIRPTNINLLEIDMSDECKKLYKLIWNRTLASQMSNAKLNIQTIKIDLINMKSILIFKQEQYYFISIFENIIFLGYLKVYDNNSSEESDKNIGYHDELKENDILIFEKIKISEEYTKPPLRYNEAGLIKFLEKNGIGRPSTYVSMITKVLERLYVEIKNIDGIKKSSKIIELNNKFKLKEIIKDIYIGKEHNKLILTKTGEQVNTFLIKNFASIIDIPFTANFEILLDKIAINKANWITVLNNYYEIFNPIVEKLLDEISIKKSETDNLLGLNKNKQEIYTGSGKYGPYIKIKENNKWRYVSIKDYTEITIEQAIELLEYPKNIGNIKDILITLNKGSFGYYLKYGDRNINIKDNINITLEEAIDIIHNSNNNKTFKYKNKIYNIKKGEFGNYIQVVSGSDKENISIPPTYDINTINIETILKIIENKKTSYKPKYYKK